MIGKTNGGSGGTGATLTVTAPAGCTVTISRDGKAKTKTAGADGLAVFQGLATGEWTLTITDGSQTASKVVTVTADYETGITFFAASINISYPDGAVCTATDGVTTMFAPDTSGVWACVVPNAGTWTVQCSYDGYMDTETVSITSHGQDVSVTFISRYAPKVTYTGDYKIVDGDTENWTIRFLTSGTLAFQSTPPAIDVFCVGGGAGGQRNEDSGYGNRAPGGGGGYTKTQKNVSVEKDQSYAITIGAGGAGKSYVSLGAYGNNGGTTTAFGVSASGGKAAKSVSGAAPGGSGGSGGGSANEGSNGGSDGGNGSGGGSGQGSTTRAFGESGGELFAGGGAGFAYSSGGKGGAGGGGDAGKSGTVNTGGGGGGSTAPGNGGSGIVIIRAFKEE